MLDAVTKRQMVSITVQKALSPVLVPHNARVCFVSKT